MFRGIVKRFNSQKFNHKPEEGHPNDGGDRKKTQHCDCNSTTTAATLKESSLPICSSAQPPSPSSSLRSRSVNDFATADELRQALLLSSCRDSDCIISDGHCSDTAWLFTKNQRVLQELLTLENTAGNPTTTITNTTTDSSLEAMMMATTAAAEENNDNNKNKNNNKKTKVDWILENYDPATTEKQSLDQELRRLLVLKSFLVLGNEDTTKQDDSSSSQSSFDEITSLAQDAFGTQIALISLVDLGRQWFLSRQGPLNATETPRNLGFCTHAIQSTLDVFEVTDATADARFCDNPLVAGPPYVRYYAGAPLISPEGYKIGTLCLIDTATVTTFDDNTNHDDKKVVSWNPRPPLTLEQRESLKHMAHLAVQALVQHRHKMSIWFANLVTTHYPDLFAEEEEEEEEDDTELASFADKDKDEGMSQKDAPEAELAKHDDEEEAVNVFLEATKTLSLDELVEMLRKQARGQHELQKQQEQSTYHPPVEETHLTTIDKKQQERAIKKKKVHFAQSDEDKKGKQLMEQVFEIESWRDLKELWWSPEDLQNIRVEKKQLVQHFRKMRRPNYVETIRHIFKAPPADPQQASSCSHSKRNDAELEKWLRNLIDSPIRGLESQMDDLLSKNRKATRRAVLQEQRYWQGHDDDDDDDDASADFGCLMESLRNQSLTYSDVAARFATNLAQVDQIDALVEEQQQQQQQQQSSWKTPIMARVA